MALVWEVKRSISGQPRVWTIILKERVPTVCQFIFRDSSSVPTLSLCAKEKCPTIAKLFWSNHSDVEYERAHTIYKAYGRYEYIVHAKQYGARSNHDEIFDGPEKYPVKFLS